MNIGSIWSLLHGNTLAKGTLSPWMVSHPKTTQLPELLIYSPLILSTNHHYMLTVSLTLE